MSDIQRLFVYLSLALSIGNAILLFRLFPGPHTPDEPGSSEFFAVCSDVGFTKKQCDFFRYGVHRSTPQQEVE